MKNNIMDNLNCEKCGSNRTYTSINGNVVCLKCGNVNSKGKDVSICCKDIWNGCCCCNCGNHYEDFYHCTTSPKPKGYNTNNHKCVCSTHKGWICLMQFEEGGEVRAYSGWSEHGMCEMWTPKEK